MLGAIRPQRGAPGPAQRDTGSRLVTEVLCEDPREWRPGQTAVQRPAGGHAKQREEQGSDSGKNEAGPQREEAGPAGSQEPGKRPSE